MQQIPEEISRLETRLQSEFKIGCTTYQEIQPQMPKGLSHERQSFWLT
ncbi:hypothetical protein AusDCA_3041 [Desulfitobacterium sp. AusDCA]